MDRKISKRLEAIINALPLTEGLHILEIGCGTGVTAREIAKRLNDVYVLGIDRSAKAIEQIITNSGPAIAAGKLHFQKAAIENFDNPDDSLFDFAFAIRVGALGGRHPKLEEKPCRILQKP